VAESEALGWAAIRAVGLLEAVSFKEATESVCRGRTTDARGYWVVVVEVLLNANDSNAFSEPGRSSNSSPQDNSFCALSTRPTAMLRYTIYSRVFGDFYRWANWFYAHTLYCDLCVTLVFYVPNFRPILGFWYFTFSWFLSFSLWFCIDYIIQFILN